MCGRIGKANRATRDLIRRIGEDELWRRIQRLDEDSGGKRGYNIAPTSQVAFLHANDSGDWVGAVGRWGLEPHWARDPKQVKSLLFNARSETAAEKPAFREAMKSSRCFVVADGFYEWQTQQDGGDKQPYFVHRIDGLPMLLGGLYAQHDWGDSFTILTTRPNSLMANLHDRMPVILDPNAVERWLDPSEKDPEAVEDLLQPTPSEWIDAYPVSRSVGNVRNDSPELMERIDPKQTE